ncbi:MAG: CdaR family protein [Megasphaera sp.]|nr:CdaR family protein [Megasphaera sp.]MCH4188343.1 CdaR family protein [Megasphaera sp.]MCH4218150.1 CdaR family protein [Megasphaera sp.]
MIKIGKKWQLKLVCLLLAIILWFVIINEQNPISEGSYTVPVTVENLDSQYITANVPKTVYVRLSGPRNTIINVGPSDIKAYIDLSNAQEGEADVPVHLEIPSGTELKKQNMTSAHITVDVYTVKEFKLSPHITGRLDNNISISSIKLVPEKVVVSGARRLIKTVDKAIVDIPVGSRDDSFSIMAPVYLVTADGSRVEGLDMMPWQSSVKVTLGQNAVSKVVPVNVTTYGHAADGVKVTAITVTPDNVTVQGDSSAVNGVDRVDLIPISIDGLDQDKEVKIFVPSITGAVIEPDAVDVKISVDKDE